MKIETKDRRIWLALIGKDEREIKKIERARARRDAHFFDDWFDKYNRKEKSSDFLGPKNKRKKDDWL